MVRILGDKKMTREDLLKLLEKFTNNLDDRQLYKLVLLIQQPHSLDYVDLTNNFSANNKAAFIKSCPLVSDKWSIEDLEYAKDKAAGSYFKDTILDWIHYYKKARYWPGNRFDALIEFLNKCKEERREESCLLD
jgi:hypothetical protein